MRNTMQHGHYTAEIYFDDEKSLFRGVVSLPHDGFDFAGTSVDELRREFAVSADEYERACRDAGREPERQAS